MIFTGFHIVNHVIEKDTLKYFMEKLLFFCIAYLVIYIYKYSEYEIESEKSVFPSSFGCGHFQENLFSFEKRK